MNKIVCREPDKISRTWPIEERPHYKAVSAARQCSDAELLAVMVRTGSGDESSLDVARRMLSDSGSIQSALMSGSDRGGEIGARLNACLELVRRSLAESLSARDALSSPRAVGDYLRLTLAGRDHEVFMCIMLDAQHRVIASEELFRGTLTQTSVYPREVVKCALRHNAAAVILAHNHPSGVAEPSQADELLTRSLRSALALVDVQVLDHFVVAADRTMSFAERGLL